MIRLLFCLIFLSSVSFAQNRTFERNFDYRANGREGEFDARDNAIKEAQSILLLELGKVVEVRQKANTINDNVDYYDEINIYTSGKVKTAIVPGTASWNGYTYSAKFSMVVDTVALYTHLDNITKQKEQAHADSLAKKQKINNFEVAVVSAKNTLTAEEKNENKLRIERDIKYNDMISAENQRNKALDAYDRAARERDTERMIFEDEQKKKAENNLNSAQREYNIANQNWSTADERVKAAKRNLETAENNLAKETGIQSITATTNNSDFGEYNGYTPYTPAATNTPYTTKSRKKERNDDWKHKIMWMGGFAGTSFIDKDINGKTSKINGGGIIAMDLLGLGVPIGFQVEIAGVKTEYAYFLTEDGEKKWDGSEFHIPYGTEYEYIKASKISFMVPIMIKLVFRPGILSIEPYAGAYIGGNVKSFNTGDKYDDGTEKNGGGGGFLLGGTLGAGLFNSPLIAFVDFRHGRSGVSSQEEFTTLSGGIKFGFGG